jgi:hypothetical protein
MIVSKPDGILFGKEVSYDDQKGVEKNGNNLQVQKLLLIDTFLRARFQKHKSSGRFLRALLFFAP